MARNVALGIVRSAVKAELGRSLATTATAQDPELNQIIFDVQSWLSSEYDWPFLRARWDVSVNPGARYLAFPTIDDISLTTAINFERPVNLLVKWNLVWQPVDFGISELEELNYLDSDIGQISDPIQRWQFDDESNFEIWPIPGTQATLRFIGQRTLTDLRSSVGPPPVWNDSATLDLDNLLVIYFTAAEYFARNGQEDTAAAKYTLSLATNRMTQVRATYPRRVAVEPCVIGGGRKWDRRMLRLVPMVVVAGKNP